MKRLIVVGVDGSEDSKAALRWAVEEARLRGMRLRVVHAWFAYPAIADGIPIVAEDWTALGESARMFVERFVEEVVGVPEGVELEVAAVHGTSANVLVDASREADLLVVGSRGHGGFSGLLLGSVSQQCVHHAACPVVVVRNVTVTSESRAAAPAAADAGR
jgi:nucleotide-binding universal stress UspA family protein